MCDNKMPPLIIGSSTPVGKTRYCPSRRVCQSVNLTVKHQWECWLVIRGRLGHTRQAIIVLLVNVTGKYCSTINYRVVSGH